ncbi:MAG: type II secretion system F family protein [Patescibacteria group bacterium]|nr:type II secretion system F family protein [Patescibacteria group bacterium]
MASPGFFSKMFDRISVQERINFARHLSLVVKAGLPVFQGLKIIEGQTESPVLKRVVQSLLEDVQNGKFLADGLQKFEHLFGGFFINIVRVGESSGTLSKNLLYLADELKRSKDLQSKVRSAMIYPMVILVATLAVAGFLTFYIFPKLIPVFSGMKVQLPITTQILLKSVNFLQADGLYLLAGIIVFAIFVRIVSKQVTFVKYFLSQVLFFIPVVSNLTVSVNMVNFTRVLGLLLKSGVKIVEAIQITGSTFSNLVYQRFLVEAAEEIKKGGQLGLFIVKYKRYFPPLVSGMVQIGESTGNLEENLEYLSTYYDEEVDAKLHALTSLIEPIMLLFMGGLVGFVALSIITPIYSISSGIQ